VDRVVADNRRVPVRRRAAGQPQAPQFATALHVGLGRDQRLCVFGCVAVIFQYRQHVFFSLASVSSTNRRLWTRFFLSGVLGYCGEVALQSIGLYYGNWIHTNTVFLAGGSSTTLYRNYATKSGAQSPPLPGNTLLVGALQNFVSTAARLGMTATTYSGACGTGAAYLSSFVKPAIDAGQPVVMGLVDPTLNSGFSYDHIVNVVGYTPEASGGGGVSSLYYNTLMYLQSNALNASRQILSRAQCSGSYAAIGSEYCLPGAPNDCAGSGDPSGNVYAHAVTGNSAPGQFFAQLQVNISNEPDVSPVDAWYYSGSVTGGAGFSKTPLNAPVAFSGQLNVFGLSVGSSYSCAMFTSASLLSPVCDHLNAPWTKLWTFVATAAVNTFSITAADFTSTANSYFFRYVCA
jgi:hypothetical protein